MVLLLAHFAVGVGIKGEIGYVSVVASVLVVLSIRNRIRLGWRWPGAKLKDVFGTLVAAAFIIFFFGAILPGHSPFNPAVFPWFAAGANFLVYAVLNGLKVVNDSNAAFLQNCGEHRSLAPPEPPPPSRPAQRSWKQILAAVYGIYFLIVWLLGLSFFWRFNLAFSHGSPKPTATQTEKLINHSHTVYITPDEKRMVHLLELSMMCGIPSAMALGVFLHFIVGVKIFDNKSLPSLD
ncbi:MAG TPA: hypothetical protein VK731_03475 [Candidatus Cybelea sp.]|nr:hypothetical protein [Candidatus Cybelea sp.]